MRFIIIAILVLQIRIIFVTDMMMKPYFFTLFSVLFWSCSLTPLPDDYPQPSFEQISLTEGSPGEMTITCRMTSLLQLTGYGIYYQEAGGSAGTEQIKVPGVQSGEDSFSVTLSGLTPGSTYTYSLYITNGRKEVQSSPNHFTLKE